MEEIEAIWKAKLAARVHDPAEKALILLRGGPGHEEGTVQTLREMLFPEGISDEISFHVRRADQWAAAADRPQFPRVIGGDPSAAWPQVRFYKEPVLIHPLSGEKIDICEGLQEIDPEHLKAVSIDHFKSLIVKNEAGRIDFRKTALAFWRFGIERPAPQLETLWAVLPADTRIPDHTIWAHLDLTAAFTTAFCADPETTPAILLMTFGPVQGFIAQSRTTSDLWAGSHLLSRLVWEGLKVICERLGPEVVLFPMLRGVPQVDLWLSKEVGLPAEWFNGMAWSKNRSDSNPLFGAALPNRFMAVVPKNTAEKLAQDVTSRVRDWMQKIGMKALDRLIREAQIHPDEKAYCFSQLEWQIKDFPEVFWVAAPWSLLSEKDGSIDVSMLEEALRPFYQGEGIPPGFFGSKAWETLSQPIRGKEGLFYRPNGGVFYPALCDLSDRTLAASKSLRAFEQVSQEGYRCSLCGEREWLSLDAGELSLPPGQRQNTLWANIAKKHEAWARKGEHLCAHCALKRLWPTLFVEEIRDVIEGLNRYVVSTHTMALSTSIEAWLDGNREKKPDEWLRIQVHGRQAALPRRLEWRLRRSEVGGEMETFFRGLPVFLDELRDRIRSSEKKERDQAEEILENTESVLKKLFDHKPEAYYGLILMDGDRMGAWISGTDERLSLKHMETWHPNIRNYLEETIKDDTLKAYANSVRSASPARHMAISGALNSFALELARYIIEDLYKGKLLYAGGDDLLAMISIDDLFPAMLTLRLVYSGKSLDDFNEESVRNLLRLPESAKFKIGRGHVLIKERGWHRLYRTMGNRATASMGAVVAHHTTPLANVLRTLRNTEQRAKNQGGRNAFALTILKRAGGAVQLTCPWLIDDATQNIKTTPLVLLIQLARAMASKSLSRRAIFLTMEWINSIPLKDDFEKMGANAGLFKDLLVQNISYQFQRQSTKQTQKDNSLLAREISALTMNVMSRIPGMEIISFLQGFLTTAEFLAREGRML